MLSVPWRPLARQPAEADTLLLLDANQERSLRPGAQGGFISNQLQHPDPWGNTVIAASGRYREGMTNIGAPHPGYAWMPAEGLLAPDQFTIELWLKSSVPWGALRSEVPLAVRDGAGTATLALHVGAGSVSVQLAQTQRKSPTAASVTSRSLAASPAATWVEIAVTLKSDTLRLYVNGGLVASAHGAVGPIEWSDRGLRDGLSLLGAEGIPTQDLTLSDLRISRWARSPGERLSVGPPIVTIGGPDGSTVQRDLLGVLHSVGSGRDRRMVGQTLGVVRVDGFLNTTPIKIGPPDASHPSLGASRRYSYNWLVVDRTMQYVRSVNAVPYVSIGSTPSLLGGTVPPESSGSLQIGAPSRRVPYTAQPPNNLTAYGTMVGDLVHHIVADDRVRVAAWGLWNEPNTLAFWRGTFAQYVDLYAVVARAVKTADPSALVGGPESVNDPQWISGFIQAAAQRHLPLDFVSFHYYTGSVGTLDATRALIGQAARQSNLPAPPLIVGEWNWDPYDRPAAGLAAFRDSDYFANDWGAAFDASSLIAMQRDGVIDGVLTNTNYFKLQPSLWTLASPNIAHAPLNVYRMWTMLGPNVLTTSGALPAGTSMIATRTSSGAIAVLIAHMRYRRDRAEPLVLHFTNVAPTARVTQFEIDRHHSDSVDAGAAHAGLEQVPAPQLQGHDLSLTLPARAVTLLLIHP